jgi:WD40 repeat protein
LFGEGAAKDKSVKTATVGGKSNKKSGTSSYKKSVNEESALSSAEGEGKAEEETDTKSAARMHLLYAYKNDELVRGRPVTSMCWNCVNLDLLTVGYGTLETFADNAKLGAAVDEELQGGLVLFWSLRNPDFPEKILRTPHAVTCLDFSKQTPSLLAVGLISGDVLVFDMRRQRESDWGQPIESSMTIEGGHTDPVWQVTWVLKGSDRLETLVSISTDGSVLEWNLKKGLVVSTLMQLKRSGVGDGWITRRAAGLCFDFLPTDPSSYMACTEDGNVHHCSIAYNEQYLNTFEKAAGGSCHDGPINRIAFSPHWGDVFLTASSDWTISLFHIRQRSSLFNMHITGEDHAISDICWCPGNSTLFAAVSGTGKLQIWDLSVSSIDPVINLDTTIVEEPQGDRDKEPGRGDLGLDNMRSAQSDSRPATASSAFNIEDRSGDLKDQRREGGPVQRLMKNLSAPSTSKALTCVKFGERSPTVVVGDSLGVVSVYRLLQPIAITHEGPLQQMEKLKASILRQTDPERAARLVESMSKAQGQGSGVVAEISS